MFGRIIVATDLHASTRMSLRAACDLLHSEGEVLLVHVIRPLSGLPVAERARVHARIKAGAAARMLDLVSWFKRERGVDIVCLTAIGSPGQAIARLAAERQADLVVLAHDPVDDPATLGSVSYQVAHLAPCAVLVLKMEGATVGHARPAKVTRPAPRPRTRTAGAARTSARVG
jgi:nucleotide-binding universal stress UspA family protein